jgi:hypothetical protein
MVGAWMFESRRSEAEGRTPIWTRIREALHPRGPLFWVAMLAVSASMAYGVPPLSYLRALPGFNTSLNSRLISIAGPCVIVLAAMGMEKLSQGSRISLSGALKVQGSRMRVVWGLVVGALAIVGVPFLLEGLGVWWTAGEQNFTFMRVWKMWGVALFCAGAVLILARLLGWIGAGRFATLALGLILLDMVRADLNFNPTAHKETFYPRNALTEFLAKGGPTERVAVVGPYAQANILLAYRIPDYRSYDATHPNRAVKFTRLMSPESFRIRNLSYQVHLHLIEPSATLMAAVGIKHVVVPVNEVPERWQERPASGAIYEWEMQSHEFWVWRNKYAMPYTYLASFFQIAPIEEIEERRMRALTLDRVQEVQIFDPKGAFPIDVEAEHTGAPITQAEAESVRIENYAPGDITVRVSPERKRFMVLNEQHTKDWRVTIDGNPAPIFRANYLVQGVVLGPGSHVVRFFYDPPSFKLGVGTSLAGLAGWLGLVGWAAWKRKRNA